MKKFIRNRSNFDSRKLCFADHDSDSDEVGVIIEFQSLAQDSTVDL